jgi:hypothetical protein
VKAISIRQPWAWAILSAGKRVENREWQHAPKYRGPVLIHAAKGCTRDEYEDAGDFFRSVVRGDRSAWTGPTRVPALAGLPRGGIVARANLVDVVKNSGGGHGWTAANVCRSCGVTAVSLGLGAAMSDCPKPDPWAIPGQLGIILADVVELPFAPVKGMLGLFDVNDEQLAAATQIGATS